MSNPFKKIGATGKFPRGKLNENDEGEISMAIAADPIQNTIIIQFGKPVAWFGFSPLDARNLISLLNEKINELEKSKI